MTTFACTDEEECMRIRECARAPDVELVLPQRRESDCQGHLRHLLLPRQHLPLRRVGPRGRDLKRRIERREGVNFHGYLCSSILRIDAATLMGKKGMCVESPCGCLPNTMVSCIVPSRSFPLSLFRILLYRIGCSLLMEA